mgnify:CR=1 FL=1
MNENGSCLSGLKLAIKVGIGHNTSLLALTPKQLLESIDPRSFTDPNELYAQQQDVNYIINNLQECLNDLLDARKKLINLGLYELNVDYEEKGIVTRQEVQISAREEIPSVLEENWDSDCNSVPFPPDSSI